MATALLILRSGWANKLKLLSTPEMPYLSTQNGHWCFFIFSVALSVLFLGHLVCLLFCALSILPNALKDFLDRMSEGATGEVLLPPCLILAHCNTRSFNQAQELVFGTGLALFQNGF